MSENDDRRFIRVCKSTDILDGSGRGFKIGGLEIAVFQSEGKFYAVSDVCSHEYEHLSEGWLEDNHIECPRHGSVFDLITGEALSLPATDPIETFPVDVRDDEILVGIPVEYLEAKRGV